MCLIHYFDTRQIFPSGGEQQLCGVSYFSALTTTFLYRMLIWLCFSDTNILILYVDNLWITKWPMMRIVKQLTFLFVYALLTFLSNDAYCVIWYAHNYRVYLLDALEKTFSAWFLYAESKYNIYIFKHKNILAIFINRSRVDILPVFINRSRVDILPVFINRSSVNIVIVATAYNQLRRCW